MGWDGMRWDEMSAVGWDGVLHTILRTVWYSGRGFGFGFGFGVGDWRLRLEVDLDMDGIETEIETDTDTSIGNGIRIRIRIRIRTEIRNPDRGRFDTRAEDIFVLGVRRTGSAIWDRGWNRDRD